MAKIYIDTDQVAADLTVHTRRVSKNAYDSDKAGEEQYLSIQDDKTVQAFFAQFLTNRAVAAPDSTDVKIPGFQVRNMVSLYLDEMFAKAIDVTDYESLWETYLKLVAKYEMVYKPGYYRKGAVKKFTTISKFAEKKTNK